MAAHNPWQISAITAGNALGAELITPGRCIKSHWLSAGHATAAPRVWGDGRGHPGDSGVPLGHGAVVLWLGGGFGMVFRPPLTHKCGSVEGLGWGRHWAVTGQGWDTGEGDNGAVMGQ